jgi:hypothetical protein
MICKVGDGSSSTPGCFVMERLPTGHPRDISSHMPCQLDSLSTVQLCPLTKKWMDFVFTRKMNIQNESWSEMSQPDISSPCNYSQANIVTFRPLLFSVQLNIRTKNEPNCRNVILQLYQTDLLMSLMSSM